MTSAQQLIYDTVGCPPIEGSKGKLLKPEPGICSITGEPQEITADARRALGENFTDHSLWRAHTGRVGPAALWCCSGKGALSPRMWSWVCAPGVGLPDSVEKAPWHVPGLCQTNRSNTRPIIDLLIHPPAGEWVMCIATSGQKHVLPYATTNHGGGTSTIRMEDTNITIKHTQFRNVFEATLTLRRMGVTAENIKNEAPGNAIKTHDQLENWRHASQRIEHLRTSPLVDLALWCITKPIMEDTNAYPTP